MDIAEGMNNFYSRFLPNGVLWREKTRRVYDSTCLPDLPLAIKYDGELREDNIT